MILTGESLTNNVPTTTIVNLSSIDRQSFRNDFNLKHNRYAQIVDHRLAPPPWLLAPTTVAARTDHRFTCDFFFLRSHDWTNTKRRTGARISFLSFL
ncbi:hypothetical protein U1Q18_018175 [Sarracenia purpurea var. burkii]